MFPTPATGSGPERAPRALADPIPWDGIVDGEKQKTSPPLPFSTAVEGGRCVGPCLDSANQCPSGPHYALRPDHLGVIRERGVARGLDDGWEPEPGAVGRCPGAHPRRVCRLPGSYQNICSCQGWNGCLASGISKIIGVGLQDIAYVRTRSSADRALASGARASRFESC